MSVESSNSHLLFGLALLRSVIGLKNSRQSLKQSEVKPMIFVARVFPLLLRVLIGSLCSL